MMNHAYIYTGSSYHCNYFSILHILVRYISLVSLSIFSKQRLELGLELENLHKIHPNIMLIQLLYFCFIAEDMVARALVSGSSVFCGDCPHVSMRMLGTSMSPQFGLYSAQALWSFFLTSSFFHPFNII